MTKISELKYKHVSKLMDIGIAREEANAEFELILKKCCGFSSKDIALDENVSAEEEAEIENIIVIRTETKRPIQQILGEAHFMGDTYVVNKNTLIPRPETELLVNEALKILENIKNPKVLDIGTGSGCISCALAKLSDAEVIGIDISTAALQIALKNAEQLDLIKKAMFRKSDIYSNVSETFDMIISNPPYIPRSVKPALQAEVRDFEPEIALFTDDEEGLEFYNQIIIDAHKHLNLEGYLLFEIGINQSAAVQDMLMQNGFRILNVIKDFSNIERVIIAQID